MKLTNDSLWLAADEMKRKWPSFIWGALFYLYTAWMIALFALERHDVNTDRIGLMITGISFNFFVFAMLTNLGFPLYRRYLSFWKNDAFTKQLVFLKQLPVGTAIIVKARIIQFVATVFLMSLILFVMYYIIMIYTKLPNLGIGDYTALAAFWTGFALIAGSLNIYWELGVSGKAYFRNCFYMIFIYLLLSIGAWTWLGETAWQASIDCVQKYGYLPAIITWIIGILCMMISGNRLKIKLNQRDLHG